MYISVQRVGSESSRGFELSAPNQKSITCSTGRETMPHTLFFTWRAHCHCLRDAPSSDYCSLLCWSYVQCCIASEQLNAPVKSPTLISNTPKPHPGSIIYVHFRVSFSAAFHSSSIIRCYFGCIASIASTSTENSMMNYNWARIWKDTIHYLRVSRYYPNICLDRVRKSGRMSG
jgi:hypothetical protein